MYLRSGPVRSVVIAGALVTALAAPARAFTPVTGEPPLVAAGPRQPRRHREVVYTAPTSVQRAALGALATWDQIWDRDTEVPLRMWGPSLPAFGAIADPAIADAAARAFLAAHLAVLAPGSNASDFELASNTLDPGGHVRTVGFVQRVQGLLVLGGSIAITFERDHLVMVSSTALPNVVVRMPLAALAAPTADGAARSFLATANVSTRVTHHGARVIVPLIFGRGDIAYRVADTVTVAADRSVGTWDVWVDANDGAAIARASRVLFASGTVAFDTPDRYPGGGRSAKPAPVDTHTVNGVPTTSDANGVVTWTSGSATVSPGLAGPLVAIINQLGALVTDSVALADAGSVTWSHAADEHADAQLSGFMFASAAKQFAHDRLNPALAWFAATEDVYVNEAGTCNAYTDFDGTIHFYTADAMCENTARIADVVYHEFGHAVHMASVIGGVGQFNGSVSEGLADTLAVSITGDPGLGRGFFYTDAPLRDVDPVGLEKKWPQDADGEVHDEGEIVGETLYDLRKALEASLGTGSGFTKFLAIFYGEMQRSVDIPSTYPEALVTDDDDGDLANGVPDECAIDGAFALHGLTTPAKAFSLSPPTRADYRVSIGVHPPEHVNPNCPVTVMAAKLTWRLRGGTQADLPLTLDGTETYSAELPPAPDGSVILYRVTLAFSDGSTVAFPDNRADPEYEMYVGAVTPIACFDFEAGDQGWTHSGDPATKDEWEVGAPMGLAGDPGAAHAGTNVLGIDLDHDGMYQWNTKQWALSPMLDLQGFTTVRLQYYRWLQAKDYAFDRATILANGTPVWTNFKSPGQMPVGISHTDREWRFHDVDLGPALGAGGQPLVLKFELDSNRGFTLGGWTIDDVCVVGIGPTPITQTCGNGVIEGSETCDDGNGSAGDGCSASCQLEPQASGGGCCAAQRDPAGSVLLTVVAIGILRRRRRRSGGANGLRSDLRASHR